MFKCERFGGEKSAERGDGRGATTFGIDGLNGFGGSYPDPFSIRCAPAVLGAAREGLDEISALVSRELNGACDNPSFGTTARVKLMVNLRGCSIDGDGPFESVYGGSLQYQSVVFFV